MTSRAGEVTLVNLLLFHQCARPAGAHGHSPILCLLVRAGRRIATTGVPLAT